jgi:hypothetical protein
MKISWVALAVCLAVTGARADSWTYRDGIRTWRFAQDFRVEAVTDARRDGSARQYVRIVKGSNVLAILNGVGFETLVESPDRLFYVGLSNSGLPGTAAIVFDRDGRLLLYAAHGVGRLTYCSESVTVDRTWFDADHPDVQFGAYGVVTLNDCGGKRINLVRAVGQALAASQD